MSKKCRLIKKAASDYPDSKALVVRRGDIFQYLVHLAAEDPAQIVQGRGGDRLVFPQLTEERRRDLGKQVKKIGEDYKVTLRNARRDIMDKLKAFNKNKQITDDEIASYEKEVQKILDKNIASVDALVKEKESEILEV